MERRRQFHGQLHRLVARDRSEFQLTPILDKQGKFFVGRDSNSPKNMIRWGKSKTRIPPMNEMSIIALFVCLDDFAILFEQW